MTIAKSPKVSLLAEGDAETRDCWSGSAQRFVAALRATGIHVETKNVELDGVSRAIAAAAGFRPRREAWRNRYVLGSVPFHLRTRKASRYLRAGHQDVVVQIGATFRCEPADLGETRLVLYCDANAMLAANGTPWSSVSTLSPGIFERVVERERSVYEQATRIWCMSDRLARSFEEDFGIDRSRLRTIFAGANVTPSQSQAGRVSTRPNALFVGKEFRRKGWQTLEMAWPIVRNSIGDAQLHVVGGNPPGASKLSGVTVHGFINSAEAEGRAKLRRLYENATVFCLPSHYEPFGVVFAEAMLAGLPCIGTDQWAMPEIITPEAGWLVPDSDAQALASALETALGNRERSAQMGMAAAAWAKKMFTWEGVAERARSDLDRLL